MSHQSARKKLLEQSELFRDIIKHKTKALFELEESIAKLQRSIELSDDFAKGHTLFTAEDIGFDETSAKEMSYEANEQLQNLIAEKEKEERNVSYLKDSISRIESIRDKFNGIIPIAFTQGVLNEIDKDMALENVNNQELK